MLHKGHRKFVAATEPSVYWRSVVGIVDDVIAERGGELIDVEVGDFDSDVLRDGILDTKASGLFLLVGLPDPVVGLVEAMRADSR